MINLYVTHSGLWKGKKLETMSKDELVVAMKELGDLYCNVLTDNLNKNI